MKVHVPVAEYKFTKEERKQIRKQIRQEIDKEAKQRIVENQRNYDIELNSMLLYVLHKYFGFGEKRLTQFWKACHDEAKYLSEYYCMDNPGDVGWLFSYRLKQETGIDVKELEKLIDGNNNEKGDNLSNG